MDELKSKAASVTSYLAQRLLSVAPGERLPTTSSIAAKLDVGFGTVEKAVAALRENKVIQTRSRGNMGTFLVERDLARQWEVASLGTVIGLLPLPNAMTFMGLATGTTAWFEETGIPFAINFKNGAEQRLIALMQGRADLIATSKRSADFACQRHGTLVELLELPVWSYYNGHEIVFRHNLTKPRREWRIGVDPTSFDHVSLCDKFFPDSPKQEVRYVNLPYAIAKGEIEASLLHSRSLVPMELATSLSTEPVTKSDLVLKRASSAVFLCHRDNTPLRAVFDAIGNAELIHEIQNAVIQRKREPEY